MSGRNYASWSPRDESEAAFGADPQATRSAEQSVYARVGESGMPVEALLGAARQTNLAARHRAT